MGGSLATTVQTAEPARPTLPQGPWQVPHQASGLLGCRPVSHGQT